MKEMLKMRDLEKKLLKLKTQKSAEEAMRFFKCGKGQYGEGDKFLGITVPVCRKIARQFSDLSLFEIEKLIKNSWHEIRFVALIILVEKFKKVEGKEKKKIFNLYLKNTKYINNWDLVDVSAYYIVGSFLQDKDRNILYKLSKSKSLWERRISIVTTFCFIRNGAFKDTLDISKILSKDKEDLIHKACGWMLREVGKKDKKVLVDFLEENLKIIPRTTLRYAIEKMNEKERKYFMKRV